MKQLGWPVVPAILIHALFAGVAIAANISPGDVIVADFNAFPGGRGGIIQLDPATGKQTTVSSDISFVDPDGIAAAPNGDLIVVDQTARRVIRVNPATGVLTTIPRTPPSFVEFTNPKGVVVAPNGDIYVSDYITVGGSGTITKIDGVTNVRTVVASGEFLVDPVCMAMAANGDIYVADYDAALGNGLVIRIAAITYAQELVAHDGFLVDPHGIAIASNGDLLVADKSAFANANGGIIRVDPSTGTQTTVSAAGYFVEPAGIGVAADGTFLVVDNAAFGGAGAVIRVDPATGTQTIAFPGGFFVDPEAIAIVPGGASAPSPDLAVAGAVRVIAPMTWNNIIVSASGVLTGSAAISATGNVTIQSSGLVTHAAQDTAGLRLTVTGTLTVQPGGLINVSEKGLRGGGHGLSGETIGANDAIVPGAAGGSAGAGASYGGWGASGQHGAAANSPYGLLENPRHVGSGGGGGGIPNTGAPGGTGGGRVTIDAGALVLNGTLAANGGHGLYGSGPNSGAGSGGGVLIRAGTVSGSGALQAVGGNGRTENNNRSGSGGGGRIAIFYDTMTFPVANILMYGGGLAGLGSAGTLYLKQSGQSGDLVLNNSGVATGSYTPFKTQLAVFRNVILQNNATLQPVNADIAAFTVEQQVSMLNSSTLLLPAGVVVTVSNSAGFDCDVTRSHLVLNPGAVLIADKLRINGGTLDTNIDLSFQNATDFELSGGGVLNVLNNSTFSVDVFDATNMQNGTVNLSTGSRLDVVSNSVTVASGVTLAKAGNFGVSDQIGTLSINGIVTHAAQDTAGLRLTVTGTLTVQPGGLINVSEKGLRGGGHGLSGETIGANDAIVPGAAGGSAGAGASYGGWGAAGQHGAAANSPYGLLENPRHVGSGGGGGGIPNTGAPGGTGGGRVTIDAGALVLNGTLAANGGHGLYGSGPNSGAGSGGGVLIRAGTVSGSGSLQAVGGNGRTENNNRSGSGGGGRIAIFYDTMTFPVANILMYGGGLAGLGSAGTLYIKDNAQAYGDLIIHNSGANSSIDTPILTTLTAIRNATIGGRGRWRTSGAPPSLGIQSLFVLDDGVVTVDADRTIPKLNVMSNGRVVLNAELRITSSILATGGGRIERP